MPSRPSCGGTSSGTRDALAAGDRERFRRCVDASFDVRRSLVGRQAALVDVPASAAQRATTAGSGGAVICVCEDEPRRAALVRRFDRASCVAVGVEIAR